MNFLFGAIIKHFHNTHCGRSISLSSSSSFSLSLTFFSSLSLSLFISFSFSLFLSLSLSLSLCLSVSLSLTHFRRSFVRSRLSSNKFVITENRRIFHYLSNQQKHLMLIEFPRKYTFLKLRWVVLLKPKQWKLKPAYLLRKCTWQWHLDSGTRLKRSLLQRIYNAHNIVKFLVPNDMIKVSRPLEIVITECDGICLQKNIDL